MANQSIEYDLKVNDAGASATMDRFAKRASQPIVREVFVRDSERQAADARRRVGQENLAQDAYTRGRTAADDVMQRDLSAYYRQQSQQADHVYAMQERLRTEARARLATSAQDDLRRQSLEDLIAGRAPGAMSAETAAAKADIDREIAQERNNQARILRASLNYRRESRAMRDSGDAYGGYVGRDFYRGGFGGGGAGAGGRSARDALGRYAGVESGNQGMFAAAKAQSRLVNSMLKLGGALAIADQVANALEKIPSVAEKYAQSLKLGYTKTEATGEALAELIPVAGHLAKGLRAFYDWATGPAVDLTPQEEADKAQRKKVDEEKQKRGEATKAAADEINSDRRRVERERQLAKADTDAKRAVIEEQQAVDEARAEFEKVNARQDIGTSAKEDARARMNEKIAKAGEERTKRQMDQDKQEVEGAFEYRKQQEKEIGEIRKQAGRAAVDDEYQARRANIDDEAAQKVQAEKDAAEEWKRKNPNAGRFGTDVEKIRDEKIAAIEAQRKAETDRVNREQGRKLAMDAMEAAGEYYGKQAEKAGAGADLVSKFATDLPKALGASQGMQGIIGEGSGEAIKSARNMESYLKTIAEQGRRAQEWYQQVIAYLRDPNRPIFIAAR